LHRASAGSKRKVPTISRQTAAFGIFQLISESFEHQIFFSRWDLISVSEAQKETRKANNSHFELEFE
jgi:hypothetical protein